MYIYEIEKLHIKIISIGNMYTKQIVYMETYTFWNKFSTIQCVYILLKRSPVVICIFVYANELNNVLRLFGFGQYKTHLCVSLWDIEIYVFFILYYYSFRIYTSLTGAVREVNIYFIILKLLKI